MGSLEDVFNSQRTSPVVRKNLLEVLAAVAYASAGTSHESESSFLVLWRKVKPAEQPDEVGLYYLSFARGLNTKTFTGRALRF
jgi:hypothetical protein